MLVFAMMPLMLVLVLSTPAPLAQATPAATAAADSLGALIGPPSSRFT